jgi:hypothetical protein
MRSLVGTLVVVAGLAIAPAAAQSMNKCYSADGSVWYTHQRCPLPNPHGDHLRKCVSPKGEVSYGNPPAFNGLQKWS